MKKLFFTTAMLMLSVVANSTFAQSNDQGDVVVGTDAKWENWFVSGGAGISVFAGDADRQGVIGSRIAPALDLSVGKWFTPYIGARFQYSGLQFKGKSYSMDNVNYEDGYANKNDVYRQKWNYMYFHVDAMFNLSNFISGYKEDRFYSLVPYAGAGFMRTTKTKTDAFAGSLGVYNSFNVTPVLDLFVDLRGTVIGDDSIDAEIGGFGVDGAVAATVGVTYKIGKQGWERPISQKKVDGYKAAIKANEADIKDYKSQLASAAKKNDDLAKQLAAAKAQKQAVAKAIEEKAPSIIIPFKISSSKIPNDAKINLASIAKVINKQSKQNYTIVGYADNKTGSKTLNEKLSKERANAVYEFLTKECGVSASKLSVSSKGGVDNMFLNDPTMSRVVIVE